MTKVQELDWAIRKARVFLSADLNQPLDIDAATQILAQRLPGDLAHSIALMVAAWEAYGGLPKPSIFPIEGARAYVDDDPDSIDWYVVRAPAMRSRGR